MLRIKQKKFIKKKVRNKKIYLEGYNLLKNY